MSKIQVPDHVAKSIEAEQKAKQQEETQTEESTENVAYVKEGARVLDPTLLEKSFLDMMHNSGYPNLKLEKKIDFTKLYLERFN